jgi:hypothetical protein
VALSEKPFDINILSKDGRRGTLSELKADFRRREIPLWRRVFALLALAASPMAYAAAMPLVSDGLSAPWFREWVGATDWLSQAALLLFPGLESASSRIYGSDPAARAAFQHFASVDLVCILATCLALLGLTPLPSLPPRENSLHLLLLRELTRGFPVRSFGNKRVGGAAGGVLAALAGGALVFGVLHVLYFDPMVSGKFFTDAHAGCAASGGTGITSLAIEHADADPCLGSTVWKLGWKSSIATAAIPIGLWFCLGSLLYPFWLALGRPTRT